MGLIRKVSSMTTLGLVDFRSAKDRTAAHTASSARAGKRSARSSARTANEMRAQTRLLREQLDLQRQMVPQSTGPAPGWYAAVGDPLGSVRWWDGVQWTAGFKP